METVIYSTHKFEKDFIKNANSEKHKLNFLDVPLNKTTAVLAKNAEAVSIFVNDDASAEVLTELQKAGVKYLFLRSAGYNNVDISAAHKSGIKVARVPAYSPHAVAE